VYLVITEHVLSRVMAPISCDSKLSRHLETGSRLIAKTCSHCRPDSTKLVSRQYIENYCKLSPTLFTPPTQLDSLVWSASVVWNGF